MLDQLCPIQCHTIFWFLHKIISQYTFLFKKQESEAPMRRGGRRKNELAWQSATAGTTGTGSQSGLRHICCGEAPSLGNNKTNVTIMQAYSIEQILTCNCHKLEHITIRNKIDKQTHMLRHCIAKLFSLAVMLFELFQTSPQTTEQNDIPSNGFASLRGLWPLRRPSSMPEPLGSSCKNGCKGSNKIIIFVRSPNEVFLMNP